MKVNHICYR